MIGAINGPDAPAAVAWLEERAFTYLDLLAQFGAWRVLQRRRNRRWQRANPGRHLVAYLTTVAERRREEELLTALDFAEEEHVGVHIRPLLSVVGDTWASDAARWPVPLPGRDLDAIQHWYERGMVNA